jgi:hypothetical protein
LVPQPEVRLGQVRVVDAALVAATEIALPGQRSMRPDLNGTGANVHGRRVLAGL